MTKKEYLAYHEDCCKRMVQITKAKNADYTGTGDDPFANFDRVSILGISSSEQGFLTRMLDKFCRLVSFVQRGTLLVKDESLEDTALDLANYCILFAGYVRAKKKKIRLPEHRTPNDSDILVSNDEIEDIIISLKSLATRERELS